MAAIFAFVCPCPSWAQAPSPTEASPTAPVPSEEGAAQGETADAPAQPDPQPELAADQPPPSTWDKRLQERGEEPEEEEEGRTLLGQLLRTVFSLAIVVALIYLFARFGLQRFAGLRRTGSGGKVIDVVERTQLDAKHALYVVDYGEERLLLGSGDRGLEVLSRAEAPEKEPKPSFRDTMKAVATGTPSTPNPEPNKEDTDA